jgi:hypothetical protein
MNVLLDESVPRRLGFELTGHFVRTAQAAGFSSPSNEKLLQAMLHQGFEVLVTFDQNLPHQQNANLPVAVVVLVAPNNRFETARLFVPALLKALETLERGQLIRLSV